MPRRKKKPLYRPRNILIAIALLFAFAVGREVYIAMTAVPGESVNFAASVAALIESGQPKDVAKDAPNAVEFIDRAIAIESRVQADYRSRIQLEGGHSPIDYSLLRGPLSKRGYPPGVFDQIKLHSEQALADLRKTELFSLLEQTAAAPRAVRPTQSGRLFSFLLPNLGKYRNFARMNGARMYMAHQAGDDAELVAAFEQTLALGRIAGHGSFLIEYLVAIAIDVLALNEIRTDLVERPVPEATLVKLLAAMDRQALPPMRQTIEGERLAVLDTIQWTHTDDGRGSGRLIASNLTQIGGMLGGGGGGWMQSAGSWRIMNVGGIAFPSKAANVRKANQFYDMAIAAVEQPYFSRGAMAKDLDEFAETLPVRYVLLRMMLPAWGKSVQSSDQCATMWAGTRTMLAIEIYKQRHGRYPAALDELAPSIIGAVPPDPFSGLPFGYRLMDPASDPHGRGYLLYSVGADRTDNAGTMSLKTDVEAFRLPIGRGLDYVFNTPRDRPDLKDEQAPEDVPAPETPAETGPPPAPAPTTPG